MKTNLTGEFLGHILHDEEECYCGYSASPGPLDDASPGDVVEEFLKDLSWADNEYQVIDQIRDSPTPL